MQSKKQRIFFTGLSWAAEITVKFLTIITLVIAILFTAEPAARTLEATFNIELPKIEVMVVLPEGEALPLEFSAEQMAAILAAIGGS